MTHTSKSGKPKLLASCQLPLTGTGCVDAVVTDRGWFDVITRADGRRSLLLRELAEGESVEGLREITGAHFDVDPELRPMTC